MKVKTWVFVVVRSMLIIITSMPMVAMYRVKVQQIICSQKS